MKMKNKIKNEQSGLIKPGRILNPKGILWAYILGSPASVF